MLAEREMAENETADPLGGTPSRKSCVTGCERIAPRDKYKWATLCCGTGHNILTLKTRTVWERMWGLSAAVHSPAFRAEFARELGAASLGARPVANASQGRAISPEANLVGILTAMQPNRDGRRQFG